MKKLSLVLMIAAATTLMAGDGKALYKTCIVCHGAKAEKKALNRSHVIQGWDKAKLVAAMKGYQDGSYGGALKGTMKLQLKKFDDAKLDAVAEYITTLK